MTASSDATASVRAEIARLYRAPEPEVLAPLLKDAALDADSARRIENRALGLLAELRSAQSSGWVNQFLQTYRLNTSEGVALLSLAEAFLRAMLRDLRQRGWTFVGPTTLYAFMQAMGLVNDHLEGCAARARALAAARELRLPT